MASTDSPDSQRDFVEVMTAYQPRLYGYILSLAGNPDAANDILQDVNVVLWKQSAEFIPGSNFKAWAFRISHFQFMAYRQKQLREKVLFDDKLVATLAMEAREVDEAYEQRAAALGHCLALMPARSRDVIRLRYVDEMNVAQMAEKLNRNANAIYQILFRARRWLMSCVQQESPPARREYGT